mmetsp:Transcript_29943/g.69922  ORF Transcript_29943/g.69922 Transcript_29943/m.69922 type:complete len:222 (-) Transcript_29943:1765-2430(-)
MVLGGGLDNPRPPNQGQEVCSDVCQSLLRRVRVGACTRQDGGAVLLAFDAAYAHLDEHYCLIPLAKLPQDLERPQLVQHRKHLPCVHKHLLHGSVRGRMRRARSDPPPTTEGFFDITVDNPILGGDIHLPAWCLGLGVEVDAIRLAVDCAHPLLPKLQPECAPHLELRLDTNPPPHELGELFADGEAQPRAPTLAECHRLDFKVGLEQDLCGLSREAGPGV